MPIKPHRAFDLKNALPDGWSVELGGGKAYVYAAGSAEGPPVASVEPLGELALGHGYVVSKAAAEGRYGDGPRYEVASMEEAANMIAPLRR